MDTTTQLLLQLNEGQALTFLKRDDFTTPDAAPITSPRTAEPGPGTWGVITDTANQISIAANALVVGNHNALGDPGMWEDATVARASGIGFYALYNHDGGRRFEVGFDTDQAGISSEATFFFDAGNLNIRDGAGEAIDAVMLSPTATYACWIILRSTGAFYIVDNVLEWVGRSGITANLYSWLGSVGNNQQVSFDTTRAIDLPANFAGSLWGSDFGIATDRLAGARNAGDTFEHEADTHIKFDVTTVPSGGQIEQEFRVEDANNKWRVTIDSAGTLDLDEIVATVVNQRGTSVGVVANGETVTVIASDEVIRVYETSTLRITYSSAANFKTKTDGELESLGTGGAVSDIRTFPVIPSGSPAEELVRAAQ